MQLIAKALADPRRYSILTERISEAPTRVLRFDPRPTMTLFIGS
jgi:hypothetical protein